MVLKPKLNYDFKYNTILEAKTECYGKFTCKDGSVVVLGIKRTDADAIVVANRKVGETSVLLQTNK